MKITFFIGSMGQGGAERVISLLAGDYVRRGWQTEIVCLLSGDVAQTIDPRVKLVNIIGPHSSYVKNALFWLRGIRQYLKREKPDRVVSFVGRINALVLTSAFGLGLPITVSERNDPRHDGRGKAMLAYCNAIYPTAQKIVFQTKAEEACFTPGVCKKGCIIPNPVHVEGAVKGEPEAFTVLTAGRLAPQKNHKMLIEAMGLIHREFPQARCVIYGEGDERRELEALLGQLGLEDVVRLPGHSLQVHQKIAESSAFVLTSEFEGLSNSLLEAMILGIPCITTDYPGADEVIEDGRTGYIVPRKDAAALAEKLKKLITDREEADRLSQNAMAEAVRYKQENVIQAWRNVIGEG